MPDDRNSGGDLPPREQPQGPRLGRQLFMWAFVLGGVILALSYYKRFNAPDEAEVDVARFLELVRTQVVELRIEGSEARARLAAATGEEEHWVKVRLRGGMIDEHLAEWADSVRERGGKVVVEPEKGQYMLILLQFAPIILLLAVMFYFFRRQMRMMGGQGGLGSFTGVTAQRARKEKPDVRFDDVAGVEDAKEEVHELVEFLRNPDKFQRLGGRVPRGVLLVGAPGTGKTLLAKAIAGEADVPFYSLCGSDFVELFVGVGAARVRDLFRQARNNSPAIIFLDEIDAVGRKRGTGLGGGHDEREQTLNAILSELDGFRRDEGVIVIAATNRPDVLDPALLRPGRFDRQVVVDMPDLEGRREILDVHARDVRLVDGVDMRKIARGTPGFTGADLEALINEATIRAAVNGDDAVSMAQLEEARDKVRFGRQNKRGRLMSEEDRKMTAYHEAGHALVACVLEEVEPLHKVTIIPRGVALGMTMVLPEKDKYGLRRRECLGTLKMNMAGRIAEEMFCGDISSGAESDIKSATDLARKMVTRWGMSRELGPICYSDEEQHVFLGNEITQAKHHSDRLAEQIDGEVQALIGECLQAAEKLLHERSAELEQVAEALLEVETLTGEQVARITAGAPAREIVAECEAAEPAPTPTMPQEEADRPGEDTAGEGYPSPVGSPA